MLTHGLHALAILSVTVLAISDSNLKLSTYISAPTAVIVTLYCAPSGSTNSARPEASPSF
jgi:hypothetical protein